MDTQIIPSGGQFAYRGSDGQVLTGTVPTQLRPRLTIGALHFWGHADLYVTFPVWGNLNHRLDGEQTASYDTGIETGVRVYPWRLESGKSRPFVGAAFTTSTFRQFIAEQQPEAPSFSRSLFPLQAGLTYTTQRILLEVGMAYRTQPSFNHYIDRSTVTQMSAPSVWFWLGVKRYFDTTLPAEIKLSCYAATGEADDQTQPVKWLVSSGRTIRCFFLPENRLIMQKRGLICTPIVLRYFLNLELVIMNSPAKSTLICLTGKTVAFDQIEFNFIQAVWYPASRKRVSRERQKLIE